MIHFSENLDYPLHRYTQFNANPKRLEVTEIACQICKIFQKVIPTLTPGVLVMRNVLENTNKFDRWNFLDWRVHKEAKVVITKPGFY